MNAHMKIIATLVLYNILHCMFKLSKCYLGYNENIRNNTTKVTRNGLSELFPTEFYSPVTVSVRKWSLLACLACTESNILIMDQ